MISRERHAERPLRAFISSVMTPELQPARDAVVGAFNRGAVLESWAFEFTPASSEEVDASYLRHVRECDLFVYIASNTVTAPVAAEVREALKTNKRMFVFCLGIDHLGKEAADLLSEIGTHAKWKPVASVEALDEACGKALDDFFVRAVRADTLGSETEESVRIRFAQSLLRRSYARIISALQSLGVEYSTAQRLAADSTFGDRLSIDFANSPVRVIDGIIGSGKSLIAERKHQTAVNHWLQNAGSPIPVFVRARDVATSIEALVRSTAQPLGDITKVGIALIVDGLDEPSIISPSVLLNEVRELINALPSSTCIVTGRPHVASLANNDESVKVPPLSSSEIRAVVQRFSNLDNAGMLVSSLSSGLHEALKQPLFSVLYGSLLSVNRTGQWHKETELIQELVNRSTRDLDAAPDVIGRLQVLAVHMLRRGGGPVPPQDLSSVGDLEKTRLVVVTDNGVAFALPIFAEWFASQALLREGAGIDAVLSSTSPDAWVTAIAMAIAMGPRDVVDRLCTDLVSRKPAIAASSIVLAAQSHARWGGPDLPPATEAEIQLRHAFETWSRALRPLEHLTPRAADGTLASMTVRVVGRSIEVHYHDRPATRNLDIDPDTLLGSHYSAQRESNAAWAWRFTLDSIRDELKRVLDNKRLMVEADVRERLWYTWLRSNGLGSLSSDPIEIRQILENLSGVPPDAVIAPLYGLQNFDLDASPTVDELRRHLASLNVASDLWQPPYPGPDQARTGSWVWSDYSNHQLARRVQSVYDAALEIYRQLCAQWFPALKERFSLYELMPLHLECTLLPPRPETTFGPIVGLRFQPLLASEPNRVSVIVADSVPEITLEEFESLRRHVAKLRPGAERWITLRGPVGRTRIFEDEPARHIAYEWLRQDLKGIDWAE